MAVHGVEYDEDLELGLDHRWPGRFHDLFAAFNLLLGGKGSIPLRSDGLIRGNRRLLLLARKATSSFPHLSPISYSYPKISMERSSRDLLRRSEIRIALDSLRSSNGDEQN
ncbi:hypothetical protein GW17_00026465 [Ensete ventricosum]|nr:hypothetical protein GW17_00026465 [Ensete ventricosum]